MIPRRQEMGKAKMHYTATDGRLYTLWLLGNLVEHRPMWWVIWSPLRGVDDPVVGQQDYDQYRVTWQAENGTAQR